MMSDKNPHQAAVDEMFHHAKQDQVLTRLSDIAARGVMAPESLSLGEVKTICEALLVAVGQTRQAG